MNRIKIAAPTLLAISLGACNTQQNDITGEESKFKNVIFIVSDDHHPEVVSLLGEKPIHTPNIDRLAAEGVFFTNAYSNSPICSASRQSMMTGKYPHATGVNLLFTPFPDEGNVTIAEYLKEFGYQTALVGKTHFNNWVFGPLYKEGQYPNHGWDHLVGKAQHKEWLKENPPTPVPDSIAHRENTPAGEGAVWGKNAAMLPIPYYDKDSPATFLANWAAAFIKQNKENPFCLWVAFYEPHAPFSFPIEYAGRYKPEDMPLPEGSPEDDRWIPLQFKDLTEDERRGIIASYYTSVEYMDKNVGIVLDALRDNGLEENTLVIFNGDQGYLLNEHKRFEKHMFWDEAVTAPFVIRGKGLPEAGKRTPELMEFIDILPTVTDLLGIAAHDDFQGKSLMPYLTGEADSHREYVFSEFLQDDKAMIASREWKYIFTSGKYDLDLGYETGYGPSGIYQRLYNLVNDPNETTNLAYKPEYKEKVNEMQQLMLEKFHTTHPDAAALPDELNTIGQLVWYCQPRDIGSNYDEVPLRFYEAEVE